MNKPVIEAQTINRNEGVRLMLATFVSQVGHLEKAARRITATAAQDGGKESASVAWLLRFLRDDLETLTARQQEEAQWDVARFSLDGGQGVLDYGSRGNWGMGAFGLQYPETAADWLRTLKQLQFDCREVLWSYLTRGQGMFPRVEGEVCIFNRESSPRYRGGNFASGFYFMAAQLLAKYGSRVKCCEGCALIILVGRKDQRFHSQNCQVASYFREKRKEDKAARLAKERARKSRTRRSKQKVAPQRGGKRHGSKR